MRREEEYVGKRVMVMNVLEKRLKVKLKQRLMDNIKHDLTGYHAKRHNIWLLEGD